MLSKPDSQSQCSWKQLASSAAITKAVVDLMTSRTDELPCISQDNVDQTSAHGRRDLVEPGFQEPSNRISLNHQDDDVDLEALVNDMNSSFESLYSTCSVQSETAPLLQNGQLSRSQLPSLGSGTLQPMSPRQKVQRSQPVRIMAVRRLQEEEQQFRTSSLPAIPNPFPELCSPASSPVLAPGSLPQSQPASKHDVKVFSEDGTSKVVEILADMTARDLCQLLVYKSHCVDDNSWTLVEHHPHLGLERCLEDHELIVQVESTMGSESKFLFRKNYAKYEFFKNPMNFFPEQMVAWCQQTNGSIPQSQLLQEPRHLQLLADLEDSNIFSLIAGKKLYNAPAEYGFCIKCEDDGQIFFSLDDGNTKFSDLIQLVEFYQLNKGVLPCKLKHHCIRVAL
ncbi:growth factor receptor-bound protein 10 isoform X2 [Turdus rufiventris]|nr:growth factor receptor-bound protein 10 isoform X2 [Turdus rufiventris]